MRKFNKYMIIALAVALLASFPFRIAFAQQELPVGVVVDYEAGQSIAIVDQSGTQHQYMLSSNLKVLPPGRADSLAVGTFVTVIAPASLNQGKQIAVGIVIHPQIPNGWNIPSLLPTPFVSGTPAGAPSATVTGTLLVQDTATPTMVGTQPTTETTTAPDLGTPSDTPTATTTPFGENTTVTTDTFIGWLTSLVRDILNSR